MTRIGFLLFAMLLIAPLVSAQEKSAGVSTPSIAEAVTASATVSNAPSLESLMSAYSDLRVGLDTVWVLVAAMLVFFMNAGFALVESGLTRAKNTVNILAKNFIVFAAASVSFWVLGWGLMFGDGNAWLGLKGLWFVSGADNSPALGSDYSSANPFSTAVYEGVYSAINWSPVPLWAKFFFQLVFAGTAATIVSGAVAERIKFGSFLVFSFILVALIYPISGHWIWGGGILGMTPADGDFFGNFRDFAGSTVVHSVGGWAALAGIIILGPRIGKYKDGKVNQIPGHNMTSAALGVFILWLGWFGFNPGSTMSAGNGSAIAHIIVNTNIAAATGSLGALLMALIINKKFEFTMILNGCLAGLVAITASCAFVSIGSGAIIGLIAGMLVVLATFAMDKFKLDDPVGAVPVHLINGIWGTLALGLFYNTDIAKSVAALDTGLSPIAQTVQQLKGILLVGIFAFAISFVIWYVLKIVMGIRVSADEEQEGLDIGEHGDLAYPDFQIEYHKLVGNKIVEDKISANGEEVKA
jgi:Amt family ammonium transporter